MSEPFIPLRELESEGGSQRDDKKSAFGNPAGLEVSFPTSLALWLCDSSSFLTFYTQNPIPSAEGFKELPFSKGTARQFFKQPANYLIFMVFLHFTVTPSEIPQ
jgi:hypothetical protein